MKSPLEKVDKPVRQKYDKKLLIEPELSDPNFGFCGVAR
jgi:hypothetical protein